MSKYYFLCTIDMNNGTLHNKYLDIKNIALPNEINESTTEIYINGKKYKFKNYYHIRIKIKSEISNFKYLFCGCPAIKSINFISMNTEKVTNMTGMFAYCSNLKDLNFQNFNTSNVTDMSNMFLNCSSLSTLCLNNFNTSKVTDMSNIFRGCFSLTNLDFYNFKLNNVKNMSGAFANCYNLKEINFPYESDENLNKF